MGLLVAANESLKRLLNLHSVNRVMPSETPQYFICAGVSGAFASAVTTPLDVVKTRLQTQGHFAECKHTRESSHFTSDSRYNGIISTVQAISKAEGPTGFFRGLGPRVALATPAAAMCWGTYEVILACFPRSAKASSHRHSHMAHSHSHIGHVHSHHRH